MMVFTPNPEILYRAYFDAEFMEILRKATFNVPDGNGLFVAEMMQNGKKFFPACVQVFTNKNAVYAEHGELIKGSDLTKDILERNTGQKKKILIIDRKNETPKNDFEKKKAEVQKNIAEILSKKFPNNEFFVIFDGEKNVDEIAKTILENQIEFVFATIGMKTQEKRIVEIFDKLPKNMPIVGLGVGASIDFLLGLQKRAPEFFANN